MEIRFDGKTALITGSSGIGAAAAHAFAQAGASVGLLGHTEEEVQQETQRIEQNGGRAVPLVADIADPQQMDQAVRQLVEAFGRIDIVFANAGINGVWAPLDELTPEDWDKTLNTNLKGTYLTIRSALPHLKAQGGAVIITSSVNGTRIFSNSGATAYSCSKAGQVAMAKMLAVELAKDNIRVNVICSGSIDTEINENTERRNQDDAKIKIEYPEGRIPLTGNQAGSAQQVADLVLFLASDAASHITGTQVWIDGAQSLLQG